MALVQRPRFYEGQVLASADLTAGLEYARSQEARHDRIIHGWGIADGLVLAPTQQGGYVTVALGAGLALDGTGREVLVPDSVQLDEQLFVRSNVAVGDATAMYPVMLAGADTPALPGSVTQSCTAAQATRTVETYKLAFGAPGSELAIVRQAAPAVDQGAGGATNQPRWWILLGFVTWDAAQSRFTGTADACNGVGRRYIGVRADRVSAQGGTLALASRLAGSANAPLATVAQTAQGGTLSLGRDDGRGNLIPDLVAHTDGTLESDTGTLSMRSGGPGVAGKPMMRLAETSAGGTFVFGLQDAGGTPSQLMTVDERGNLTIAGVFNGLYGGGVKVASGIASHGVILPLPDGITNDMIASGQVSLHVMVTPRPGGSAPYDADLVNYPVWICGSMTAHVDGDRRLHCLNQWIGFHGGSADLVQTIGGTASYLMCAVVRGGTP